jgi:hypothetical protein
VLARDFRREHVRERQVSVLRKLLSEKTHLPLKRSFGKMPHPWASLPVMGLLPNPIYAREALSPMSIHPETMGKIYVPFVGSTDAPEGRLQESAPGPDSECRR